ncbi:hypothetical protein N5U20_04315 [Aliarcobacter butzleri]|uniref:hypothetical protein n=1 Tax=Aliarcobacter butzleri TaxID=28197 RepID=UPI0021B32EF6|nr:hypothetical protein [Aliarcobacter butzleri]MCT7612429.1 hypothetical protein [Aliarcobacter butzleri]MCT7641071.1 hypothetical protein [Aliarcobacter butzleri]
MKYKNYHSIELIFKVCYGYNKYLHLKNEISVEIDYEKFYQDSYWDGLKGYITNTNLSNDAVISNYSNLW